MHFSILTGFVSHVAMIALTASAKFESASKVSIYREAFGVFFAFAFQIIFFRVSVANSIAFV